MRLGGSSEVAKELGVSAARITVLRQRPDFPDPVGEIAQGFIWDLDVILAWQNSGLRNSKAGRPKASEAGLTLGGRFLLEVPPIGRGGFANVYRAADKKTADAVALKMLHDVAGVEEEAIKRFQRELRIMEKLTHPNVVPVLAQGETKEGEIWYAMPLAQGSLSDYVQQINGNPALIVDIMRQICAGLHYIHLQGICHRDLKPGNVLRLQAREGENDTWAISDFGLAVQAERDTDPLTSTLRQGLGSWVYTAPEQWQNARSANAVSDIYSLGKILQELATGEWPVNAEIPSGGVLRPVIEKAIANDPGARYQSVPEFIDALDRAVGTKADHEDWESRSEKAERLRDRLLGRPNSEDLVQIMDWALALNEQDDDDMKALARVLPWMNVSSIGFLWSRDGQSFGRLIDRFTHYVSVNSFSFEYCDALADFLRRVVSATNDSRVLGRVVVALARLGANHNRWHVRDVLVGILQGIKSQEGAAAASEALRSVPVQALTFSVTDFTLRSLPVAIRNGIGPLIATAS